MRALSSDERLLAESANYYIVASFESCSLYRKSDDSFVCVVGDHYGDPTGAVISPSEDFCVTVGCGAVVYFLRVPFEDYSYSVASPSWYEFGRDPKGILWIESVTVRGSSVVLVDETGQEHIHEVQCDIQS